MPRQIENRTADTNLGSTRAASGREPSVLQQSSDDEAAAPVNQASASNPAAAAQPERATQPDRATPVSHEAIAEAAYWRAQQRGFAPGNEIEDWLAAERELMEREGAGGIG